MVPMSNYMRGTDAVMPVSAFVQQAGSRQRKRGKLPKLHPRALHRVSVSQRGRAKIESSAAQSCATVTLSSQP